jgi:ATP-dependent Clp protease ATP-binding subunit ClpC
VGREEQVERVIQIICRRMKNNPCLIGEPGVGKTSIIQGLAQRILSGYVPEKLKGKKVSATSTINLFITSAGIVKFVERIYVSYNLYCSIIEQQRPLT